jgi:hypothetical protein
MFLLPFQLCCTPVQYSFISGANCLSKILLTSCSIFFHPSCLALRLTRLEKLVPAIPLMSMMVKGSHFLYLDKRWHSLVGYDVYWLAGWLLIWESKYLENNSSIRTENILSKWIIEHWIIEQKRMEQSRTESNNWKMNILINNSREN